MKKILVLTIVLLWSINPSAAHDFDADIMEYILSTPDATWSDFSEYIQVQKKVDLEDSLKDTREKIELALELPGKKYVGLYTNENPRFTYKDLKEVIGDDPMLVELGIENIYSYLDQVYAPLRERQFDISFLWQTVMIGFMHILGWVDHILFIATLLICLPRFKRIVGVITTFTVAHCITIVLWWLGIVSVPSVLVESMILISIIIMGIFALFSQVWEEKNIYFETALIFVLWLFHGLGFAWFFWGILETSRNIVVPVLWFNMWVELWQILIITILLSFLHFLYTYADAHKNTLKNSFAVFCCIFASYYLVLSFL